MAPRWHEAADKHGIPRSDQEYAIASSTYDRVIDCIGTQRVRLFIGHPHPQTEREIEILVRETRSGATVFHAMELGPKYRRYREEHR